MLYHIRTIISALAVCFLVLPTLTICKILADYGDWEVKYEAVIWEYGTDKNPNGESVMCGITKHTSKPKENAVPLNYIEIMFSTIGTSALTCRTTDEETTVSCKVSEEHSNSDRLRTIDCPTVKELCDSVKGTIDYRNIPITNKCNYLAFLPDSLSDTAVLN